MQENESLALPDGRTLAYCIYGNPTASKTVFFFHAFPSSRLEGRLWHPAAQKLDVRLISPDRPGMGNSTYQDNRTLLDWPKDVLALAEHLHAERFYVMGMSGGGPYTLACWKAIPKERLLGATIVSGLYPVSLGTAGMMFKGRLILWVAPWMTGVAAYAFDSLLGNAARNPDKKVLEDMHVQEMQSRPEGDRLALLDPKNKDDFLDATREAMRQGGQGTAWEARLNGCDWGFKLEEIEGNGKVMLWHGDLDVNVPVRMAREAAKMMNGVTLKVLEGETHCSFVFRDQEDVLRELVER